MPGLDASVWHVPPRGPLRGKRRWSGAGGFRFLVNRLGSDLNYFKFEVNQVHLGHEPFQPENSLLSHTTRSASDSVMRVAWGWAGFTSAFHSSLATTEGTSRMALRASLSH